MNASLVAAITARCAGRCEACGCPFDDFKHARELDHALGRREPESESTIWALCRTCHQNRHAAKPSAVWWLKRFIEHCEVYGLDATKARFKLLWRESINALPFGRGAA